MACLFALGILPAEVVMTFPPLAIFFFFYLIQISCWWTALNLLPIFPLDGGQIMQGLMKSRMQMHLISMTVAVVMCLVSGVLGFWMLMVFMVLLAVLNHKFYRELRHGGTDFH
jgi:Zn-dependent protease